MHNNLLQYSRFPVYGESACVLKGRPLLWVHSVLTANRDWGHSLFVVTANYLFQLTTLMGCLSFLTLIKFTRLSFLFETTT